MEDLKNLSRQDLERRLNALEEELEELEEEKSFVLKQTGLHVGGGKVKQYEAQTQALQQSISELKSELAKR
ncbi:hypothetical protein JCM15765_41900 [Paradesulfitobacterium aromaticivorans]